MAKLIDEGNTFQKYTGKVFTCPSGKKIQIEGTEIAVEKSFSAGYGWQTDELPAFKCPACGNWHAIRKTEDGAGNDRDPHYYLDTAR